MKIDGLLPIVSVVKLNGGTRSVMIMGLCQRQLGENERVWDYSGVLYPQGYISGNQVFMFNHEQIVSVYFLGYQDDEQISFMKEIEALNAKAHQGNRGGE